MKKMELKENVYELIDNSKTRLLLAIALNVGETTIRNYINNKSQMLTLAAALKIISQETGLTQKQLLTESVSA